MFCIHCGSENPDSTKFCNACGKHQLTPPKAADCVTDPAVATPRVCPSCGLLSPASASICDCGYAFDKGNAQGLRPATAVPKEASGHLNGVGGWLLLFCIGSTILTPIMAFGAAANSRDPVVWFLELALAGVAITTGVSLWSVRKNALWFVKVYFAALLCLAALALLGSFSTTTDSTPLEGATAAVRTFAFVIIWGLYFKKSKRVKHTYGVNL